MKRVAEASAPPIVISIVIIAVDIDIPIVVPLVECGQLCEASSMSPSFEYPQG